eukprot:6956266-Ditylum_brightwellii.AAC.1
MEWTYDQFKHLRAIRNQDCNTSKTWKLYQCVPGGRNMKVFNTSYMPFEGFEAYLSGFENVHEDPNSTSLFVAVHNNIHLRLYVTSHIYPEKCVLGKRAKGRINFPDYRLFAYGIHTKANSNGLEMLHSGGSYNWNAQTCVECKCSCKDSRCDAWIVIIPELHKERIVGSLSVHSFSVFKVPPDMEMVTLKTME